MVFTNFCLFSAMLMFFFADVTGTDGFGIWGMMFVLIAVTPVFVISFRGSK